MLLDRSGEKPLPGEPIVLDMAHPLARQLEVAMPLNQITGSVALNYATPARAHTPLLSGSSWVLGRFGTCLRFAGTDYNSIPYQTGFNSPNLSGAIWFKTSTTGTDKNMLRRDDDVNRNFLLRITTGNVLQFLVIFGGNPSVSSSATVTDGNWHLASFSMRYDGTNTIIKLYLDGVLQGSNTATGAQPSNSLDLLFGGKFGIPQPFVGDLDHPLISTAVWSDGEHAQLFREPFAMYYRDPLTSLYYADASAAVFSRYYYDLHAIGSPF